MTVGSGFKPASVQEKEAARQEQMERLEANLKLVKAMYKEKTGHDVDSEDDEDTEPVYDSDGTPWVATVGTGFKPASVKEKEAARQEQMGRLEASLRVVKALYKEKTGHDVDSEDDDAEPEYDS